MTITPPITRAVTILEIAAGLTLAGGREYHPATVVLGEAENMRWVQTVQLRAFVT
jgi:hypothetical protein